MKKDFIKGGKSDSLTVKDVAEKHGVPARYIKEQLRKGIAIELEHTDDVLVAAEIALDHLYERPDYYSKLVKMEKEPLEISALREEIYRIISKKILS